MANKPLQIAITEQINASPATIFSNLVKASEMTKWFPNKAETEPVVGGHFLLTFDINDEAGPRTSTRKGQYLELDENKRVRYTWDGGGTDVTFDLTPKDGGTEVTLVHDGWNEGKEEHSYQHHLKGWEFFMANLKSVLETGVDARAAA